MENFEPKILAFCCNWCSYAGADLAGTSRMQYPTNVRIIRVMCSGRVNPFFILKALSLGADGVLVLGCHPGDCHYLTGNYRTRRRLAITMKLMEFMGIEPERIQVSWCSASEGSRFAEVVNGVTAEVKQMGPNRLFND
ncbi:MAG: hydrogenase iron-sulfur subunit [Dehalococcoidia bacterium]|jgi:F420-non-reducing hydrogenase iron-sulfur subunit